MGNDVKDISHSKMSAGGSIVVMEIKKTSSDCQVNVQCHSFFHY